MQGLSYKVIIIKILGRYWILRSKFFDLIPIEINILITPNLVLHFIASWFCYPVTAFHRNGILRPFAHTARRSRQLSGAAEWRFYLVSRTKEEVDLRGCVTPWQKNGVKSSQTTSHKSCWLAFQKKHVNWLFSCAMCGNPVQSFVLPYPDCRQHFLLIKYSWT